MTFRKGDRDASAIYQHVSPDTVVDADHIHPRSKGGTDDVANLQFLDPAVNRAKSDHVIDMRGWQEDFIQDWDRSTRDAFLLVAIPGAGKTKAALWATRRYLQAGFDRRVIIAVPTVNVREQWAIEAQHFGISLQTKDFGTNFKDGFVGGVCTYSYLARSGPPVIRKICATAPTLVILDEPHHLAVDAAWGDSARQAFELSKRKLLLSGTPFRTDGLPIPWVRYDGEGVCIWDHRYDYPDAIRDAVVRNLVFDFSQGNFDELFLGDRRTLDFNGELSADDAADRLRRILHPGGEYVAQMIRLAHAKLQSVRQAIPDAGAMAVCMDITHAQSIARVIRDVTGCQPSIVVSEEDTATDTIDAYRKSAREWVVSVRQIIEGTDIKRLHVLLWATHATTEMIFRQLIGRVSRVRFQDPNGPSISDAAIQADLEAYVFLPADPRLIEHAKRIQDAQIRALKAPSDDDLSGSSRAHTSSTSTRVFLGSAHTGLDSLVIGDHTYSPEQANQIEAMARAGGIKTEAAAKLFDAGCRFGATPAASATTTEKTDQQRCDELRQKCHRKAYRLAKLLELDVKEINRRWPPHRTMGVAALQRKLDTLINEIAQAERPWQ